MTAITRARLKYEKPTRLPRRRIIDLLHNDNYLRQLEMWQACEFNIFDNSILNPDEPREKWVVERVGWDAEEENQKGDERPPIIKKVKEKLPLISPPHHRLSTIAEVEEEAHRISIVSEEPSGGRIPPLPLWMPF